MLLPEMVRWDGYGNESALKFCLPVPDKAHKKQHIKIGRSNFLVIGTPFKMVQIISYADLLFSYYGVVLIQRIGLYLVSFCLCKYYNPYHLICQAHFSNYPGVFCL